MADVLRFDGDAATNAAVSTSAGAPAGTGNATICAQLPPKPAKSVVIGIKVICCAAVIKPVVSNY